MVQIVRSNVEKHSVKMMEELNRMKEEKDHCDFVIQVGNAVYNAHKNVLSAGSDYFKAMLKHDTKESREGKVVFRDVDFECVKNCVDFIYSGKLEITDEKMNDLLHVAIMMQLEDIKQTVSDILEESITIENYFSTRNVADMYGLDAVLSQCRVFFHANIMEISNQPEFGNIAKIDIFNLVKSQKFEICEEELLMLLLNWVEKNQKNQQHLQESLEAINFDKISPAFWENLLESNSFINNDLRLYKLLNGYLVKAFKRLVKSKEESGDDGLISLSEDERCAGDVELKTTANPWKPIKRNANSKRSQKELDTLPRDTAPSYSAAMTTQPRVLRGQFPQSKPHIFGNPQQHQFSPNPAFSPRHTVPPSSSLLHHQQFYQPATHEMYKGPGVSSTPPMMGMSYGYSNVPPPGPSLQYYHQSPQTLYTARSTARSASVSDVTSVASEPKDAAAAYGSDKLNPANQLGKRQYDHNFLLQFQYRPSSLSKPKDLPNIDYVLEDGSGKRERRLIKIIDPSTNHDITNNIMNSNSMEDSTSSPSSGRSSITGTPPIG